MTREEAIDRVLDTAIDDDGVRESPPKSNDGVQIRKYLAAVGLGPGYRYCAAAVSAWGKWALGAGVWPVTMSADCDVLLAWGRKHGVIYREPKRGDIFLLVRSTATSDAYHTGYVTKNNEDGTYDTIEANTNKAGSADGDGVYKKTRAINSLVRFVRWADAVQVEDSATPTPMWRALVGPKEIGMSIEQGPEGPLGIVPLRALAEALFDPATHPIEWDAEIGQATFAGAPLPSGFMQRRIDGKTWVRLGAAADFWGLEIERDLAAKTARLVRPKE